MEMGEQISWDLGKRNIFGLEKRRKRIQINDDVRSPLYVLFILSLANKNHCLPSHPPAAGN
jgi:hypothetical protein